MNIQDYDFFLAQFKWQKWQIIYFILISFVLSIFAGTAASVTVLNYLTYIKIASEKNIIYIFVWGIFILAPSLFFVFQCIRKGFIRGILTGVTIITPQFFFMIFERFLPDILSRLLGAPFSASLEDLFLTVASLISIILAFISTTSIFGLSHSNFGTFAVITGLAAFFSNRQGGFDAWLGVTTSFLITIVGYYIARKAISEDERFLWLKSVVIVISSFGRKSFRKADLTDADFTQATLVNVDLREAKLIRTRWYKAKGLEYARVGNSYLKYSQIRKLVTTLQGQDQKFDGLNMEGVNVKDANLQDASFIGTNLNNSSLRNANLSRAVLKQIQLDGADLTGAILTGAYIEDWGITSTTNLESVRCEYIFMRLPTKDDPNPLRKPDNLRNTFTDGEFVDFIKPYFDTLDLYHSQDVDPRAISIALKNLSDNHPEEELEFIAIERRGHSGLNLRFKTRPEANKSELSNEYFTNYGRIKKELPIATQLRLAQQDAEIRTLKGTIEQFIQTRTVQTETIQVIQGEMVVTENRGININADGNINDISGLVGGDLSGVMNLGTISGNVSNTINQLPDKSESEQPNLKELLLQLQEVIQNDSELLDPDKADLLEQVQALAEAKQVDEPTKKQGLARKAMKMFDATLKSLPDTAKVVEACNKLLPLILKALGLPA